MVLDPDRDSLLSRWIERGAWVVALVGGPIAAIVGLTQLHEIAVELAGRPKLEVGFIPSPAPFQPTPQPTIQLRPLWTENDPLSLPLELTLLAENHGRRSATHLPWNIWIPEFVEGLPPKNADGRASNDYRVWAAADGRQRITSANEVVHPGDGGGVVLVVRLPRDVQTFEIHAGVSMSDAPATHADLRAQI